MRVALLNLRFSPNLGDVLLCECLEFGLRRAAADIEVLQIDITGRRDFGRGNSKRLAMLAVLQRLPRPIRQQIARFVLGRSLRRTLPYWESEFRSLDAAVLGGGNLLADADLNFPLKVRAVLRAVADASVPAGVYAVGVSDNWSRAGASLFREALTGAGLVYAAVRDEKSRDVWRRRLGSAGIREPRIVRDPGLLASECYPALARPAASGSRVGVCISHPVALRYHADEAMPSEAAMTSWFIGLVRAFSEKGYAAFVFTTGSPEDEVYLDKIMPSIGAAADHAGRIERVPAFADAAGLAGFISTLDLLMGHRLHACIAAYSYGIPHIGLTWDTKMQSFFASVGRSRYICSAVATSVTDVVSLAEEARHIGIDARERKLVIAETHADIAAMLKAMARR